MFIQTVHNSLFRALYTRPERLCKCDYIDQTSFVAISFILFQMRHYGRLLATLLRMKYECLLLLLYTN